MKKSNIINLIKYFSEHNDNGFRTLAAEIASEFDSQGDTDLSNYIMSMISTTDKFVPQYFSDIDNLEYCSKVSVESPYLFLPQEIDEDIMGIIHALGYNAGVHKFMFCGAPGSGKTETVKQIARLLERELYSVNFDLIIDSKLGQTAKNISDMFTEINSLYHPERVVVLLDEIDSLAMSRIESNDIREMGRATSALMKGLDSLNSKIALFATTNLIDQFDKALLRRFDSIVNFNRYSQKDLLELSENILDQYLKVFSFAKKDTRLFKKIMNEYSQIPYPGDIQNLIKTSLAFSEGDKPYDYLRRMYKYICSDEPNVSKLKTKGYSIREIEKITGISKSSVARETCQLTTTE